MSIAPILIASAVRRSGTTLVQRLLCSASNSLIYGESCAHELLFAIQMYFSKQMQLQGDQSSRDVLLEKVLRGETDDWIADLMPPVKEYIAALHKNCFGILEYYRDFAAQQGREVWGLKMAEWPAMQLIQTQQFFPDTKLIYIERDLVEVARSARKVNFFLDLAELEQFCRIWQQNTLAIREKYPADQVFFLDYQQLLDQPEIVLPQLEQFTGALGIQAGVLQQRINTFKADLHRAPEGDGYMAPAALSQEEIELIETFTSKYH